MTTDSQQRKMDIKDHCDPLLPGSKSLDRDSPKRTPNNCGKNAEVQLPTTDEFWWAYEREKI